MVAVVYPRYEALTTYSLPAVAVMLKFPEMSLTVVCFIPSASVIVTVA